jgi:hypothetical protein
VFLLRSNLLLLALLGAPAPLSAQEAVPLEWSAPATCLDAAHFEAAFAQALSAPFDASVDPETSVRVVFDPSAQWRVEVRVAARGAVRTRTLQVEGGACHALDEGLIVVVALLLEDVHQDVRALASEPAPPPAPIALQPRPEFALQSSATPLRGQIGLGAQLRVDALPGLAIGPSLSAELAVDVLSFGLSGVYFPARDIRAEAGGIGAEVSAMGGSVFGCAEGAPLSFLELGGCISASALAVSAIGSGLSRSSGSVGLEVDLLFEARARLQLVGPLALRLQGGLGVALVRSRIFYEVMGQPETLHVTSQAFPVVSLLLELRLGQ